MKGTAIRQRQAHMINLATEAARVAARMWLEILDATIAEHLATQAEDGDQAA